MIAVPFSVAVVIMVLGALIWLAEQPKKARERSARREARARLAADLRAPKASTNLPYGLSASPDESAPDSHG